MVEQVLLFFSLDLKADCTTYECNERSEVRPEASR